MKKKIKIFLVNIFLIFIIFFLGINLLSFRFFCLDHGPTLKDYKISELLLKYREFLNRDISPANSENIVFTPENYRPIENINSQKKPIVLFGCSNVQGCGLNEDQTFSYKLGKATGRPIYNRAMGSWGINQTLYQLSHHKLYEMVPEPEFIIYKFWQGHYSRMYNSICYICPQSYVAYYKEKGDSLVLKKRTFISDKIIALTALQNVIFESKFSNNRKDWELKNHKEMESFMLKHFKEMKKYQNENWPNAKFIVFYYEEPILGNQTIKEIEKMGYITFKITDYEIDIYKKEYKLWDGHPTEKFWDDVVPIIVKQFNL